MVKVEVVLGALLAIKPPVAEAERGRLVEQWKETVSQSGSDLELLSGIMGREGAEQVDRFDQAQLAAVIRTCRDSQSLSEAGRALFAVSRVQRKSTNDADRLKK
jgi:transcriptional regulatory protein RtcR